MAIKTASHVATIILCVLSTGISSCSDKAQQKRNTPGPTVLKQIFHLNTTFGEWNTTVYVNGEPVFIDSGIPAIQNQTSGGFVDITPFFMNGSNLVTMKTRRTEASKETSSCRTSVSMAADGPSNTRYSTLLGGIFQKEGKPDYINDRFSGMTIIDPSQWPSQYDAEFQVDAEVPFRWTWQDGEIIEELSRKDKQDILTEYHKLIDAYKSKDYTNVTQTLTQWHPGLARPYTPWYLPIDHQAIRTQLDQTLSRPDYEVLATADDQLEFISGRKLVLLMPKTHSLSADSITFSPDSPTLHILIYAGSSVKSQESSNFSQPYTGQSTLYFFKKNDKWHMLPQNWLYDT